MTERPILFSGEMVRAILGGRQTQFRRVVKPQPLWEENPCQINDSAEWYGRYREGTEDGDWRVLDEIIKCPYGQPGDKLWVKETWKQSWNGSILYRADQSNLFDIDFARIRPSIHMPRWAGRINLTVTGVRVERVQDITDYEAGEEGVEPILVPPDGGSEPHREGFMELWDSINAERGYSWESNPWVWVVKFEVAQ